MLLLHILSVASVSCGSLNSEHSQRDGVKKLDDGVLANTARAF